MPADALKQRLVGAVALLLLGVIAWFTLLRADNPVDPMARATQIPQAPDIKPFAVPEPAAPKDVEPIGSERDSTPVVRSDAAVAVAQPAPQPAPEPRPAAPKPQPAPAKAQEKPVAAAAAAKTQDKPAVAAAKPATKPAEPAPAKPAVAQETFALDQHGLPVAWVVQVGSFSTQANADKMKQTLQEKGFKAYSQAVKTAKGSAIKVYVGPKLSRERADAQKKAIDEALKTNSMVVRFPVG